MTVEVVALHDDIDIWADALERFQTTVENAKRDWAARLLMKFPHKEQLHEIAEVLRQDLSATSVQVNSVTNRAQITLAKTPEGPTDSLGSWASSPIRVEGVDAGAICTLELDRSRVWSLLEQRRIETAALEVQDAVYDWFHSVNKAMFL